MLSHTIKQLKLIVPCGLTTYWLGTATEFRSVLQADGTPAKTAAYASIALGSVTVVLFMYILVMPWLKGIRPNFVAWRESKPLSTVIPMMTFCIVVGSNLLGASLGLWSSMSYLSGIIAAYAVYGLGFGILGLIPVAKVAVKTQRA